MAQNGAQDFDDAAFSIAGPHLYLSLALCLSSAAFCYIVGWHLFYRQTHLFLSSEQDISIVAASIPNQSKFAQFYE
jgi:hypothetical protein